jgi:hypothetical protein
MRILVHVTMPSLLRHFDGVLVALAERGHSVHVAASRAGASSQPMPVPPHERISLVAAPPDRGDEWSTPIRRMRAMRDFLRYLDKPYKSASKLRARALGKLITGLTDDAKTHVVGRCPHCGDRLVDEEMSQLMFPFGRDGRTAMAQMLDLMEATIPSAAHIESFLREQAPDAVLVTPLINFGSHQADYVKSARALGIPVGFPVFSWDNLSNKGLIHVQPDRLFVWNELQRDEAVRMHRVPQEHVVITGAPRFDTFFAMRTEVSREAFCADYGFDPAHPIVTYLCSSEFVAGHEREFVMRWVRDVRRTPALSQVNILIRPHPRERLEWKNFEAPLPRVALSLPLSMTGDQRLRDTLEHSVAAVGLNTSAQLEAGIVGRPVLTILAPEFAGGQRNTIHFGYLLKDRGGFVELAPDIDTHLRHLTDAVTGKYDLQPTRDFIARFLRPHGIDRPATGILVDAIEALAQRTPAAAAALPSLS